MTSPPPLSGAALTRAILAAMRQYTAAQRTEPRDQKAIDAARAELEALEALRDG